MLRLARLRLAASLRPAPLAFALRLALVLGFAGRCVELPGPLDPLSLVAGPRTAQAQEDAPPDVPLHGESVLRFAAVSEGAARLGRADEYTAALSRFDCQVRLGVDRPVTEADLRRHAAAQVVAWSDADAAKIARLARSLRARMARLAVPLPPHVLLVQTTGREEGDAAYCRYPAIVLPRSVTGRDDASLERLLAHELFHIVSRHDPELRRRLYQIVGFESCAPVPVPPALRDRKITNPDAPVWDALIRLDVEGRSLALVPILYASVERYDPAAGGTLFKYLQFRLMTVEPDGDGGWRARLTDGRPELFNPKAIDAYAAKIGRNTGYIIHPDEILADNFAHLVLGKNDLPDPQIVDRLRLALSPRE